MAAGYFIPDFPCCSISEQRYAYNGEYDIFGQGQPDGHMTDPLVKSNGERKHLRQHIAFGDLFIFGHLIL